MIESTIQKLDGSGRQIEVIQLRNLEADQVAGTIQYLMMEPKKDDRRNSLESMFIFGFPGRSRQDNTPKDEFRVDADVVNNRLILTCAGLAAGSARLMRPPGRSPTGATGTPPPSSPTAKSSSLAA